MQLTKFSDYAIRVLLYTESINPELATIDDIAKTYDISRAHLMKVVNSLTKAKVLTAVRGRSGGVKLARPTQDINLVDVLRVTEPNFDFVECMGSPEKCCISGNCKVERLMYKAKAEFFKSLAQYSLQDIAIEKSAFLTPSEIAAKQ